MRSTLPLLSVNEPVHHTASSNQSTASSRSPAAGFAASEAGVGFGDERVGKNAVTGNFARGSVQQTVYRALCHIPITQAKSHHATYGKADFKTTDDGLN